MTLDPAHTQPPAAVVAEEIRAARQARRELEWARRDAEDAERARADQRIDKAATVAVEMLPNGVGAAVAVLLEAMKPFRASDGHLSISAIGRSSPEVLALAEALLAPPPPPTTASTAEVLAGLREEMQAVMAKPRPDQISDYHDGVSRAIALVEAALDALSRPKTEDSNYAAGAS